MEILINLIPDYKKEEIIQSRNLKLVVKLGIGILFLIFLLWAFLFAMDKKLDYDMKRVMATQDTDINKDKYEKIKAYDEKFASVNSQLDDIGKIKNDQLYWSNLAKVLEASVTSGVAVSGIVTKDYNVSLSGTADSREDLLSFKDNLDKSSCFSQIDLPLSNLVSQDNIAFQMDLKIKKECLKNK